MDEQANTKIENQKEDDQALQAGVAQDEADVNRYINMVLKYGPLDADLLTVLDKAEGIHEMEKNLYNLRDQVETQELFIRNKKRSLLLETDFKSMDPPITNKEGRDNWISKQIIEDQIKLRSLSDEVRDKAMDMDLEKTVLRVYFLQAQRHSTRCPTNYQSGGLNE